MAAGQGFASLEPARRTEVARQGGQAAHAQGAAHTWTAEEARAAGRKGGEARAARKQAQAHASPAQEAPDGEA